MTDEGQLDLDHLLGQQSGPTKTPARKRKPTKTASAKTREAAAPLPGPEQLVNAKTSVEPPSNADAALEPVVKLESAEEPAPPEPGRQQVAGSAGPTDVMLDAPFGTASEAPTAEGASVVPATSRPSRLFFLTNAMNLNGVLSSRVLAPRESFHKYYSDLLELAPGWVPIFTGPPPASLIERVISERGAGPAVLVELSQSVLDGQPTDAPVHYVRAALFSDVKAIHFGDEKSLRTHRTHAYGNIHPHDELLRVSPELFMSESDADMVIAPPIEGPATDWLQLDRVRGAVNAALAASDHGEALAVTAGLFGARPLPTMTNVPPWLTWAELTGAAEAPVPETDAQLADRLVFRAAYRVLGERDRAESWSAAEVLEAIAADIIAATPSADARVIIDRNLQRVREIVNIERDFEPFRNPGSPYVAAKSLLMVLLRPDLRQLLDWPTEEINADETTRVVAALLAGRLRGIARESVNLRSMALDDITAAWAVRAASGEASTLGSAEFTSNGSMTVLVLDGVELRRSTPLLPDPVSLYEALDVDARLSARIAISRSLGWPVQVRIHLPAGSDVRPTRSVITITSTERVRVEAVVDEVEFLTQLQTLFGPGRKQAVEALRA